MQAAYRREGALSQYLAESEVLWLLLAWLGGLDRRSYSCCALHAGTVATACAWDSKWRAGVRVVSYH